MNRTTPKRRMGSGPGWGSGESPSLQHRKQQLQRIALLASFLTLVAAVTGFRLLGDPIGRYDINAETVASQTIQAAFAFDSQDLEATREARTQAAAAVPS